MTLQDHQKRHEKFNSSPGLILVQLGWLDSKRLFFSLPVISIWTYSMTLFWDAAVLPHTQAKPEAGRAAAQGLDGGERSGPHWQQTWHWSHTQYENKELWEQRDSEGKAAGVRCLEHPPRDAPYWTGRNTVYQLNHQLMWARYTGSVEELHMIRNPLWKFLFIGIYIRSKASCRDMLSYLQSVLMNVYWHAWEATKKNI